MRKQLTGFAMAVIIALFVAIVASPSTALAQAKVTDLATKDDVKKAADKAAEQNKLILMAIADLKGTIDANQIKTDKAIAGLGTQIGAVDKKVDTVIVRLGKVEDRLGAVEKRVGTLETDNVVIKKFLVDLDKNVGKLAEKLDTAIVLKEEEAKALRKQLAAMDAAQKAEIMAMNQKLYDTMSRSDEFKNALLMKLAEAPKFPPPAPPSPPTPVNVNVTTTNGGNCASPVYYYPPGRCPSYWAGPPYGCDCVDQCSCGVRYVNGCRHQVVLLPTTYGPKVYLLPM